MLPLLIHPPQYWLEGTIRTLEGLRRGLTEPYPLQEDPSPVTPYAIVYEGGLVRLRHYRAVGQPHATPLLLVYAPIKRPFILDLQPGRSVVETLTHQGFEVYLTDWIPPTHTDRWRGVAAYVNEDLANAVRAVQLCAGVDQVSLLGYSFGGLLTTIYTALHPEAVKNLVTFVLPLDMSARETPFSRLADKLPPETLDLITATYGNCPAWLLKAGFTVMAPLRLYLPLYLFLELREHEMIKAVFSTLSPLRSTLSLSISLDRHRGRRRYEELFALFERWMNSDVPLAGQIFQEVTKHIFQNNLLIQGRFQVDEQTVHLQHITCPVLNVIGIHDRVVPPTSSLPLIDLVGSRDKQNLLFPAGHIGAAVSLAAQQELWPQVGAWLKERDKENTRTAQQ